MQVVQELSDIQEVINKLEELGYRIHLTHFRQPNLGSDKHEYTVMTIEGLDGLIPYACQAVACCSEQDTFCKAKGTQIAFRRLMRMFSKHIGRGKLRKMLNQGT